jgi:hypothetical protein
MQVVNASAGSVALSAVMYWQALQANSGSSAIAFIMQARVCASAPRQRPTCAVCPSEKKKKKNALPRGSVNERLLACIIAGTARVGHSM